MTAEKMPHEIYLSSQFGGTVGFEPFAGAVKYVRAEPVSDTPRDEIGWTPSEHQILSGQARAKNLGYEIPDKIIRSIWRVMWAAMDKAALTPQPSQNAVDVEAFDIDDLRQEMHKTEMRHNVPTHDQIRAVIRTLLRRNLLRTESKT